MKELIQVPAVPVPAVVVGVDGTAASAAALSWAAAEAQAHQAPLTVVYVLDPRGRNAVYSPSGPEHRGVADETFRQIKELVEKTSVAAVEQVFEVGIPARVLVRVAGEARLLVIGHSIENHRPGIGEHQRGPELGSVARACVARAACPVVVVPLPLVTRPAPSGEHHAGITSLASASAPSTRSRAEFPWLTTERTAVEEG